jgi:hypothetical protein
MMEGDNPMKQYLDDRLYPVDQGCVIRGAYRGARTPTFKAQRGGDVVARSLVATSNGWHRVIITVNGREAYRTTATRDRAAARALLNPVR